MSNPTARRSTSEVRETVSRTLADGFELEHVVTGAPGEATEVARTATHGSPDLVVVLGGDGTLNEVANGLVGSDIPVAVLGGGAANVWVRALGAPADPVAGATALRRRLLAGATPTRVPLGRIDDRYFLASCGVGLDAAIVRAVEADRRAKRLLGDWFFVWSGLRLFFLGGYDRRTPAIRVSWGEGPSGDRDGLFLLIVQNVAPFTYLGRRPLDVCPRTRLGDGLDCLALDSMRTAPVLRVLLSAFGSARHPDYPHVLYRHGETYFDVRCDRPMPVQADGEYVGERTESRIRLVPDALAMFV